MELTQEQLAEIIAKLYASIKAKKGDGAEITVDDITAELASIFADDETENAAAEASATTDDSKSSAKATELDPDIIAQITEALGSLTAGAKSNDPAKETKTADPLPQTKSAEPQPETKSVDPAPAPAPMQRKYAQIFIQSGANRDSSAAANSFKSRIEKMSAPERRKTAYGMFGRAIKCINTSEGDVEKAAFTAEHKFNDSEMAREFKALSATVPSDGGYLIPEIYANEIIEILYPSTVIYSLGARKLGMSNGNLTLPKLKTGARAMFTGENRKISKTEPKFGSLRLSAKKLTALIPMSNDLLRSTNFDNDVIVGQDVTQQMALGVDFGALFGTGSEFQPLGILNNKKVLNIDVAKIGAEYASNDGVLTAAFPNYLIAAVLKNNVYAGALGFTFNTSVEQVFKNMRDNTGGFLFAAEMNEHGTLAGYPYRTTNLFETNAAGKTQIVFGNWNDLVIGEQGALEIDTSRDGSWTDENGQLVSAFENDQTLIRAIDNVDVGLRHEESFAVATNVSVPI